MESLAESKSLYQQLINHHKDYQQVQQKKEQKSLRNYLKLQYITACSRQGESSALNRLTRLALHWLTLLNSTIIKG